MVIAGVEEGSLAEVTIISWYLLSSPSSLPQLSCMLPGDYLTGIEGTDVRWESHERVVTLIKAGGDSLTVRLVTPLDKFGKYGTVRTVTRSMEHCRGKVTESDGNYATISRRAKIGDLFNS